MAKYHKLYSVVYICNCALAVKSNENIPHINTLYLLNIFTTRHSYASAVLGVVFLSFRLSHACFVTNPKNLPAIFYTI